jgi:peptidoglycan/xylan/chitin deacetylase (PgdA/CDA1 family)
MPLVQHLYPPVPVASFEAALVDLKRRFTPVDYTALALRSNASVGRANAVHLSFDDGFVECFTVVRPLLLKQAIPCTFFVATDWLDNRAMFYRNKVSLCIEALRGLEQDAARMAFTSLNHAFDLSIKSPGQFDGWMLSLKHADTPVIDMVCKMLGLDIPAWLAEQQPYLTTGQVKQLHADGFTIGAHTRSHPKLAGLGAEEIEAEIVESARAVQAITGQAVVPFSFPNSGAGVDRALLADIRARHPFLGLLFDTKGVRGDEPFIANRIWAEHPAFRGVVGRSNIGRLLKNAYQEAAFEGILALRRGRRNNL